jgi:hypothetical protein
VKTQYGVDYEKTTFALVGTKQSAEKSPLPSFIFIPFFDPIYPPPLIPSVCTVIFFCKSRNIPRCISNWKNASLSGTLKESKDTPPPLFSFLGMVWYGNSAWVLGLFA